MRVLALTDREIKDFISEALNENDIELIQWIEKFRDTNHFGGQDSQSLAVNDAFKFACNEIIKHINES